MSKLILAVLVLGSLNVMAIGRTISNVGTQVESSGESVKPIESVETLHDQNSVTTKTTQIQNHKSKVKSKVNRSHK